MLDRVAKAMLKVVMDQSALGGIDGSLDRVQLLNDLGTRPVFLNQPDHIVEMTARTLKAIDHLWMARMDMVVTHGSYPTRGMLKSRGKVCCMA